MRGGTYRPQDLVVHTDLLAGGHDELRPRHDLPRPVLRDVGLGDGDGDVGALGARHVVGHGGVEVGQTLGLSTSGVHQPVRLGARLVVHHNLSGVERRTRTMRCACACDTEEDVDACVREKEYSRAETQE